MGVSPNAHRSATSANLRQSGEPLKSNTDSFTNGSSAAYKPSSLALNVFPARGSAETRTECHISGTVTSWPRSSGPIGAGFHMSVALQASSGVRPTGTASGSRSATHSACLRCEVGSRWMNTWLRDTSRPEAIASRAFTASSRPLP